MAAIWIDSDALIYAALEYRMLMISIHVVYSIYNVHRYLKEQNPGWQFGKLVRLGHVKLSPSLKAMLSCFLHFTLFYFISCIYIIRTLHDCPSQMNENLLISNSKLTSDSELIWWR